MRHIPILCGNNGLFLDYEMERGADGANTGYAFPDMLCDVVRLSAAGEREAAHDLFDAHLPLLRYEQQPGIGLAVRKYLLHAARPAALGRAARAVRAALGAGAGRGRAPADAPGAARPARRPAGVQRLNLRDRASDVARRFDRLVVTCEHAGNVVPKRYAALFAGHGHLLPTHRGWDPGALLLAREMAERFDAPLFYDETTRLLVDLNRSVGTPSLHSEATRHLPLAERREILERHYHPHRRQVDAGMAAAVQTGDRVVHIASHSFTPELHGHVRTADIGLLYDPGGRARWPSARPGWRRCTGPTRHCGCAGTIPTSARATAWRRRCGAGTRRATTSASSWR